MSLPTTNRIHAAIGPADGAPTAAEAPAAPVSPAAVPPVPEPLLLDAAELARLLGVSERHVRRLDAAGLLPKPLRLGRAVKWRRAEIVAWIDAGCPDRERWGHLQKSSGMRG